MIHYVIILALALVIIFIVWLNFKKKEGFVDYNNILKGLSDLSDNLSIDINKLNLSLSGTDISTNIPYSYENLGKNPYNTNTLNMSNYIYNYNTKTDFNPINNLTMNIPHYISGDSYKKLVDSINSIKQIIINNPGSLINERDISNIVVSYNYMNNINISTNLDKMNTFNTIFNYASSSSTYQDFIHLYCLYNLLKILQNYTKFLVSIDVINNQTDISGISLLQIHSSLTLYIYGIFSSYLLILDICVPYFTNQTIFSFANINTYTGTLTPFPYSIPTSIFPSDLLAYTKQTL